MFKVVISHYPLSPEVRPNQLRTVYVSRHKSPFEAARRLATIIAGRSTCAKAIAKAIPRGNGGRYVIVGAHDIAYSLNQFRDYFCVRKPHGVPRGATS